MVQIPRAVSDTALTTQTTAPRIGDVTSFTRATEATTRLGKQLIATVAVFRERRFDKEATDAKIAYSEFQAELEQEFLNRDSLDERSREEFIQSSNAKREELSKAITSPQRRSNFLITSGATTLQKGAVIASKARNDIIQGQINSFFSLKEAKIKESLSIPAGAAGHLVIDNEILDEANLLLRKGYWTQDRYIAELDSYRRDKRKRKLAHDQSTNAEVALNNLVSGLYGFTEADRKLKAEETERIIANNAERARESILEQHRVGALKVLEEIDKGESSLERIEQQRDAGVISEVEEPLFRAIQIGSLTVPTERQVARAEAQLRLEFQDLIPDETLIDVGEFKKASRGLILEDIAGFRQRVLGAKTQNLITRSQAITWLRKTDGVMEAVTDQRAMQIFKAEKALYKNMQRWADRSTPEDFREQISAELNRRLDAELEVTKDKSPEIVQAVMKKIQEDYIRELHPEFLGFDVLPNSVFSAEGGLENVSDGDSNLPADVSYEFKDGVLIRTLK